MWFIFNLQRRKIWLVSYTYTYIYWHRNSTQPFFIMLSIYSNVAYLCHRVLGLCRNDVVHSILILTVYRYHQPNYYQLGVYTVDAFTASSLGTTLLACQFQNSVPNL
jgi:hypothetical protein